MGECARRGHANENLNWMRCDRIRYEGNETAEQIEKAKNSLIGAPRYLGLRLVRNL